MTGLIPLRPTAWCCCNPRPPAADQKPVCIRALPIHLWHCGIAVVGNRLDWQLRVVEVQNVKRAVRHEQIVARSTAVTRGGFSDQIEVIDQPRRIGVAVFAFDIKDHKVATGTAGVKDLIKDGCFSAAVVVRGVSGEVTCAASP